MSKNENLQGKLDKAQARLDEIKSEIQTAKQEADQRRSELGTRVYGGQSPDLLQGEIAKLEKRSKALQQAKVKAVESVLDLRRKVAAEAADKARSELEVNAQQMNKLAIRFYKRLVEIQELDALAAHLLEKSVTIAGPHPGVNVNDYEIRPFALRIGSERAGRIIQLNSLKTSQPELWREVTP